MAVHVRAVDLDGEQDLLVSVLERNFPEFPHGRRFKWIYRDSPLGPAWSWLLWDSNAGQPVGVASVFPRAMWVGDKVELCGQVGDFAIDPTHRSLGPALMLQRATFEPVNGGHLALCYDCPPNARGMSTFRRLRMVSNATTTRYTRLLRADRPVAKRLGRGRAAAVAARLGNTLLHFRGRRGPRVAGLDITVHTARFDEEFSILDRRVGGGGVIRGRRTAEDLNWRYRDDPLNEYQVLTARRRGELLGFAVSARSGTDALVVDLFGVLSAHESADLLDALARLAHDDRADALYVLSSDGHPLTVPLRQAGFRARESGPYVVGYGREGDVRGLLEQGIAWRFAYSDVIA
jgi:hypothetical protein